MESRALGQDGPQLSTLGLGCNNFGMRIDAAQTAAVVDAAIEVGITHFDTAEMYGQGKSEEFLGAALGDRRSDVVIATKFLPRPEGETYRPGDLGRRIAEAAEGSLRRLGTDYIDLYYQHYPDPDAPVDELLDALEQLVVAGKVRYTALSNVDAGQIVQVASAAIPRSVPVCGVQIHWNLLERAVEESVVPAATANGLGVVPYFPLASGLLTGKYQAGAEFPEGSRFAAMPGFAKRLTPDKFELVDRLTAFAEDRGHDILELAFAWLFAQSEVVSVIAGATTPEQVHANAASTSWSLSRDDLTEIDALLAA